MKIFSAILIALVIAGFVFLLSNPSSETKSPRREDDASRRLFGDSVPKLAKENGAPKKTQEVAHAPREKKKSPRQNDKALSEVAAQENEKVGGNQTNDANAADFFWQFTPRNADDAFRLLRFADANYRPPESIRKLAEEIVVSAGATNAFQKTRALYDWITANISYDREEWEHITSGASSYTHAHDPETVFERGTTVCIGYAWLFDALSESLGIHSECLIGDVRGYRGGEKDDYISPFKHAWNIFSAENGEYALLDATWGASANDAELQNYYYNTPPEWLSFDHYAEETADGQTLQEFYQQPNLKPAFFLAGLKLGEDLSIIAPEGFEITRNILPSSDAAEKISVMQIWVRKTGSERWAYAADFPVKIISDK